ncbi:MAG: TonB-dependent receptor domain-containing protein [Fidelibacterota bacterium]
MKMIKMTSRILIMMILLVTAITAQDTRRPADFRGAVQGRVLDNATGNEIGYANVVVHNLPDSSLVDGAMSDENGSFYIPNIPAGRYYVSVKFIGFYEALSSEFRLTPQNATVTLEDIRLKRAAIQMSEVEVVGDRPVIEFKADKRVINADQFAASLSGTAVEILENVPSIDVDVEGTVTLRGSSNFIVMIDGHPSIFEGSDALDQIPATLIQTIEIITNPSARYDPDGTTGIINIVTKKQKITGVSGQLSVNAGNGDKYGANAAISMRYDKFTWNNSLSWNDFQSGGQRTTDKTTTINDTAFSVLGEGRGEMHRKTYSYRTSLDWRPTDKFLISAQFNIGHYGRSRTSNQIFEEYPVYSIYRSLDDNTREGDYWGTGLEFTKKFDKESHDLSGSVSYRSRIGSEFNETTRRDENESITDRTKNTEDSNDSDWRLKLDYKNMASETRGFEAGIQSRISMDEEGTGTYGWDTTASQYVYYPQYSHQNDYEHVIHSLYAIYKRELGPFQWQWGARGEYTYRNMHLNTQDTTYLIDRWDVFPSLHVSLPLSDNNQVMASYTRRIDRPRNWYLEPYATQRDAYSVFQGNPGLEPEYINAWEASWQLSKKKNYIAADIYHRTTENKVERVQSVIDKETLLFTFANVGKDYSTGAELSLNVIPYSFWNIFLSGNLYRYRVEGSFNGRSFDNSSNNWGVKFNNTFFVGTDTRIQFDTNYHGPSVTSQSEREGFWIASAAVKYDIGKKWTAALQVRDVFGTGRHEFTTTGPNFINATAFERESPIAILSLTYRFNNYKNGKNRPENGEGMNGDEDDLFLF